MLEFFVFLAVVISGWALVYAFVIESRRKDDAAAANEKVKNLNRHIEILEHQIHVLSRPAQTPQPMQPAQPAVAHTAPATSPFVAPKPMQPTTEKAAPPIAQPPVAPITVTLTPEVTPPPPPPPPPLRPKTVEAPPQTTQPESKPAGPVRPTIPMPPAHHVGSGSGGESPTPQRPPSPAMVAPPHVPLRPTAPSSAPMFASVAKPPRKPSRSFEEIVGTNWLPKLGVVLMVVAIALLAASKWEYVATWWLRIGPWGRDALVLLAGLGLLAGGIKFESQVRYKVLGRSMIGGGWATIFLVAYLIRHVELFKVLPSDAIDLGVLLLVATIMVWHTLRYNSQTVTGLAFLLGFSAVTINPDPPFNLFAGAILVGGMTFIVHRYQWFELECVGVLASYANHFYWLYNVYEQQGGRARFPYHSASVGLVIAYWAIFRVSYLVRKVSSKQQEFVSTFAGVLNPILFLIVMKYQGFHPEWAWKVLLAMGAVEFALGQLSVSRRRRAPFRLLSSLGVTLMVAAPALRFSGNALEIIWLAGAEAFLLAGIFTRERLFRGFGLIISFLVALYALVVRLSPLVQQIFAGQPHHDGQIGLVLAVIALALYLNAHVTRSLWPSLFEKELDNFALTALSWVASLFAVAAIFALVPEPMIAVALALLVAALSATGKLFSFVEMIYQAHWIATAAFIQVLVADRNLETPSWFGIPQRVLVFAAVAALLYLSSRFVRLSETQGKTLFAGAYAWAGTSLITLLIWFQAKDWAVAVWWIGLGLALSSVGQFFKRADLKWQALVLVLLSTIRAFLINFDVAGSFHQLSYRLISVTLIAAGIYLTARWAPLPQIRPVYSVAGTILLVFLAFKEAQEPWPAVCWIGLALALCLAARFWKDRALLWQTHLLAALATGWTLYTNYDLHYRGTKLQLLTMGITFLALYALTWISNIAGVIEDGRISQLYAWAGSLLVSWLLWYQLQPNAVSLAWGVFAWALFDFPEIAGKLKIDVSRWAASWRAQGYVALAGSFVHIFYSNFNELGWGPAAYAALPLAPIYFYIGWQTRKHELSRLEKGIRIEFLLACLGTATLAAIARFELPPEEVVIGYAGLVVGTVLVAWLARQQTFLFQSLVMVGVTAFRMSLTNFYHLHEQFSSSLSSSIWALALLGCAVPLAFQARKNAPTAKVPQWFRAFSFHPEQPMFFVPVALSVVLLYLKVSGWKLAGDWAVEGLIVWVLALWARERSFRLTGLGLVFLALGKIVFWDAWQVQGAGWIAVGAVGIIVTLLGFLYSRYREALRDYL